MRIVIYFVKRVSWIEYYFQKYFAIELLRLFYFLYVQWIITRRIKPMNRGRASLVIVVIIPVCTFWNGTPCLAFDIERRSSGDPSLNDMSRLFPPLPPSPNLNRDLAMESRFHTRAKGWRWSWNRGDDRYFEKLLFRALACYTCRDLIEVKTLFVEFCFVKLFAFAWRKYCACLESYFSGGVVNLKKKKKEETRWESRLNWIKNCARRELKNLNKCMYRIELWKILFFLLQ